MAVPKEMRVSLAFFMLMDEADNWWDMLKTTQDVTQMAWIQFEELFLSNYFLGPLEDKKKKNSLICTLGSKEEHASDWICIKIYTTIHIFSECGGRWTNIS